MRNVLAGLFFSLLAGCATQYQPFSFLAGGGFSETQLDTNTFKVTFRGNGYTETETTEELALLRSAELTLKNGFSYFVIVDGRSSSRNGTFTTPTQSFSTANVSGYGNNVYGAAHTTTYGGQTFFISFPTTTNTIICFHQRPNTQGIVYDAQFLCNSLGQKYAVVCNKQ